MQIDHPILQFKNVSISYTPGKNAVNHVNADIKKNRITAIMGPSGCGKSTLLRAINRMHELYPDIRISGEILMDNRNILKMNPMEVRRMAGMVFQRPNPFPTMSIFDNVIAGYKLNGIRLKKKEKEEIVLSEFERKEIFRNRVYKVLPVIAIILLILLWVAASSNPMSKFPSPGAVWERYLKLLDRPIKNLGLLGHIWASLRRVFIALGCAWLIGISFGILIGWNKKCNALFGPIFTAFRAVPPLAWVPLMTIWFGTGEFPKVLIVFIGALMPVVVNTQAGISNVIKEYLDIGTIFHANERQMLFEIAIPSALDAIFAGIRNSTSAGWMVVLAAEMLGGKSGVGFLIVRGMDSGDYPLCLLSMICIGVVGYLLAIVIQLLERIICPWTRKKSA